MIGFKVFRNTPTTIDLNGPTLSFLEQPVGITTIESTASFTGIVTSTPVGTGHLSYQWYEVGVGAVGSATTAEVGIGTTLTLTGLVDPDDSGRQFYLESSYVASAYGSSPITAGTARSTGNALNAPLDSDTVSLGVAPTISITTQPGIATVVTDASASFGIAATVTDGTINNLTYRWQEDGSDLSDSTTVAGSATTSLTISSDTVGVSTIRCVVSHTSASNSPLNSNTVDFNVVSSTTRKVLYIEEFDVNATLHSTQEVDLVDGALEIIPDQTGIAATSNWNRIYSIYAPESDLNVKVTLSGAAGETVVDAVNPDGTNVQTMAGGEGGTSEFNLTLTQSEEYVANLGAAIWPSGGNAVLDGGKGGGGSFFYKGGELLVASGGGGGGSNGPLNAGGRDGSGGGIGVNPTLPTVGFFPGGTAAPNQVGNTGGSVNGCTIGNYWQTQGISPCASIGSTTFFTGQDGQKTSNFNGVSVTRGYKAGLNYQFNGGNGNTAGSGGGGGGSIGGNGGGGSSGLSASASQGGLGFDGLGSATGTFGGNTRKVGYIKIEAV
jgi:hypothetical protein